MKVHVLGIWALVCDVELEEALEGGGNGSG